MKEIKRFITITLACCAISTTQAQLAKPYYKLPDPLLMNDGKTKVESLSDWNKRRQEIGEMIHEIVYPLPYHRATSLRPDDRHKHALAAEAAL